MQSWQIKDFYKVFDCALSIRIWKNSKKKSLERHAFSEPEFEIWFLFKISMDPNKVESWIFPIPHKNLIVKFRYCEKVRKIVWLLTNKVYALLTKYCCSCNKITKSIIQISRQNCFLFFVKYWQDKQHRQVQSQWYKIPSDGIPIGAVVARCLGTPGQTKVSGDRQRETTHEICCLAAELAIRWWFNFVSFLF